MRVPKNPGTILAIPITALTNTTASTIAITSTVTTTATIAFTMRAKCSTVLKHCGVFSTLFCC